MHLLAKPPVFVPYKSCTAGAELCSNKLISAMIKRVLHDSFDNYPASSQSLQHGLEP